MSFRPLLHGIALTSTLLALPALAMAASSDSTYSDPALTASTAPPWRPPLPVSRAETWETVLRFPGRVLSLPLVALGNFAESNMVEAEQSSSIDDLIVSFARSRKWGVMVLPASLGDGTGLGGEVRWAPTWAGVRLSAGLSGSVEHYNRTRISADRGPVSLAYQSDWRPSDSYFGTGISSTAAGESNYGEYIESATIGLTWVRRTVDSVAVRKLAELRLPFALPKPRVNGTRLNLRAGPRAAAMTPGRDPRDLSFERVHPAEAAGSLDRRVEHFTYGAGLSHDERKGIPHWSQGWRASVDVERHDRAIEALALRDAHSDARSFGRATYEGEAGASFGRDPRTLRLAVRVVDQRIDSGSGTFLLADLATLGGGEGLRGYEPNRFRDLDAVLTRLTYIYPLAKNFELELHGESGGVYPNLGSVRLSTFRSSFGASLRVRTELAVYGLVGFDRSPEGTRLRFSIGGDE